MEANEHFKLMHTVVENEIDSDMAIKHQKAEAESARRKIVVKSKAQQAKNWQKEWEEKEEDRKDWQREQRKKMAGK
ncbi:MAG TPA: hypothetical protein VJC04_01455 [Candidatus Paceibacterota bacterium]